MNSLLSPAAQTGAPTETPRSATTENLAAMLVVAQLRTELDTARMDSASWRRLAQRNQEEVDSLRRAAGCPPDDTSGEALARVYELRRQANRAQPEVRA